MARIAVVVDDHPMCRHATSMALGMVDPDCEVIEAQSLAEARDAAGRASLMTVDLSLPDSRGVAAVQELRQAYPALRLLVISGSGNPAVERQVATSGAQGYLPKSARISEMVDALRTVLDGGRWFSPDLDDAREDDATARLAALTPAQLRVLRAMEGGRLNKQIAYDLGLSEITVKAHVKAILKKLEVVNRTQAVLLLKTAES